MYMSKTVSLRIHLKHVHRYKCDMGGQTNFAQYIVAFSATRAAEVTCVVDSSGAHTHLVQPMDVLLGSIRRKARPR